MTRMDRIETPSNDIYSMLLAGLESELGPGVDDTFARYVIACEEADFHWQARTAQRPLGRYESVDDEAEELERVAITGCLAGAWYAGVALVDGGGAVQDLLRLERLSSETAAAQVFAQAR